jgi:TolB-like protein/class 3 adenylate cyclase
MERRLTAILAADVVGYSRLMGLNEAATLTALKAHRRELIDDKLAELHGRIVKVTGDGMLVEFGSVVNAVACAADIQRAMVVRNQDVPSDRRIEFRVGINLGDVIVDGDDIFGDGVNVAARLEAIAPPGGISVSAAVRDQIGDRLDLGFKDIGEQMLKNIARPIRVFQVRWEGGPSSAEDDAPQPLALPSKPSIAVLPFTNMSGDPEQEYFADGLVEDVTTHLSKLPGLFVIARNSSFAYKGKAVDIRKVAAELGVRYVLEGSVRRAANRLRITGQLIEGTSATHVWADKFDGAAEDLFDLQDRFTASIVGALEPSIRRAEIDRARHKRPDRLDAYDLFLKALPHAYANTAEGREEALRFLYEALRLDPNYAVAHAYAAWCHEQRFFRGGFHPEDATAALKHSTLALALGADDAQALSIAAFVQAMVGHDYDNAIRALNRALELNENSALALGFSALVHSISESYEAAIAHAGNALRLSPFDPFNYHPYLGLTFAYLFTGRFEEAIASAKLAVQSNPTFSVNQFSLVACLARAGCLPEAEAASVRLLEMTPGFTVEGVERMGFLRPHVMAIFAAALRKGGLPG